MKYSWNVEVPPPIYIADDQQAQDLLRTCLSLSRQFPGVPFGFDTETHAKKIEEVGKRVLDWMADTVTFWSLAYHHPETGQYSRYCLQGQHLNLFSPLLENPDVTFALWNAKYDAHVCFNSGIDLWNANLRDALIMAFLFDENLQGMMSLKERAKEWIDLKMTKFTDLFGVKGEGGERIKEFETSLFDLPVDKVADYASLDAYATLMLYEYLVEKLTGIPLSPDTPSDTRTMMDHFLEVEVQITKILWRMERRGLGIDIQSLQSMKPGLEKRISVLARSINRLAGPSISTVPNNWSSYSLAMERATSNSNRSARLVPGNPVPMSIP
jgi:DNA polymerase I-like protein with 3'-5' exonuclease and polymerase domains